MTTSTWRSFRARARARVRGWAFRGRLAVRAANLGEAMSQDLVELSEEGEAGSLTEQLLAKVSRGSGGGYEKVSTAE